MEGTEEDFFEAAWESAQREGMVWGEGRLLPAADDTCKAPEADGGDPPTLTHWSPLRKVEPGCHFRAQVCAVQWLRV